MRYLLTAVLLAVAASVWASGTTIPWFPPTASGITKTTITTFDDTWLNGASPDANAGTATTLDLQPAAGGWGNTALLKADLSGLPAGEPVVAAHLRVRLSKGAVVGTVAIQARRVTKDWVESTATWRLADTGSSWSLVGAKSLGNRLGPVGALEDETGESATYDQMDQAWIAGLMDDDAWAVGDTLTIDVTETVRHFVDGTWANYGWHLCLSDTTTAVLFRVHSSEAASLQPVLDVWTADPDTRAPTQAAITSRMGPLDWGVDP